MLTRAKWFAAKSAQIGVSLTSSVIRRLGGAIPCDGQHPELVQDMEDKPKRSPALRLFNALCATALIAAVIFILVAGFHSGAMAMAALAIASVAVPVVIGGEGIADVLTGLVEALVDGVIAIIECIVGAISGLFG